MCSVITDSTKMSYNTVQCDENADILDVFCKRTQENNIVIYFYISGTYLLTYLLHGAGYYLKS
jgi:hypothetical protein